MFRTALQPRIQRVSANSSVMPITLVLGNLLFNIVANASFKLSSASSGWRSFLAWQIVGNLAGLITVITLTWLLRYIPLNIAFPVTTGLTVIGVQVVAASWLFHEPITSAQWLGTLLTLGGILLISRR